MAQREQVDDIGLDFWDTVFSRDLAKHRDRRSLLAISQEARVPFSTLRRWKDRLVLPPDEHAARRIGRAAGLSDEEVLAFYDRVDTATREHMGR
jgi:hypothetical protein